MVDYLSKKPKLSFVDDPGKLYRKRRRATQAKGVETLDPKAKVEGPSKSPRESPPPSPKEDQPKPPECEIELCTSNIIDLPIINLQDAGGPFKIKRRMEKMEIEKEAQHLKAAKARSTCEDCEEHDHVQGNPDLMQVRPSKIWFLFVHNSRTSWTSKLRSTRAPSLSSRLWRKY
jgi:hypothetical protein